jgi:hypothetical protein
MLYTLMLPRAIGKHNKCIASQNAVLEKLYGLDRSGLIQSLAKVKSEAKAFRQFQVSRMNKLRNGSGEALPAYSPTNMAAISFGVLGLRHMRLFRTEGSYVGKGPQSIQTGDEIWVFPGAQVPFILRKVGGDPDRRYRLIGHAYVHGIMHGEAVTRWVNSEPEAVVLE